MKQSENVVIVIILAVVAVVVFLLVFFSVRNKKYKEYVLNHSVAINQLKAINKNYYFLHIPNYDWTHNYDNSNFYDHISCWDYLLYKLVYEKSNVRRAMDDTLTNKLTFDKYNKEIINTCVLNVFNEETSLKNKSKIAKIEEKEFKALIQQPVINFSITVRLNLKNTNGYLVLYSKSKTFSAQEIRGAIDLVCQKRGSFYVNEDVWKSICRVERGKVSNKLRFAIYARDNYRCRCCGRKTNDLEIDHIVPIAKGGKTTYDNLQTLCHRCNMRKGTNIERW